MDDFALREIYIDICNGYSVNEFNGVPIYIKHFCQLDQYLVDKEKRKYFNVANDRKIPSLKEKMEWLSKESIWTKRDELNLERARSFWESLKKGRSNLIIKAQIRERDKEINMAEKEYYVMLEKRDNLVGLTAEIYAEKRIQNYYVFHSFYKNELLSERFFTDKEFKDLEDEEMESYLSIYYTSVINNSHSNIKKVSISPFFTNYFNFSDKNSSFFGKPAMTLSFNQVNLLSYGQYFNSIMSNHHIPENIRDDPEKIEDFITRLGNADKIKAQVGDKEGRVAIIGATKEDADVLGGYEFRDTSIGKMNKGGGVSDVWAASDKNN